MKNRWWAKAILVTAVIGAALLPIGALGTRFGLWSFQIGLLAVAVATALALVGLLATIIAGIVIARKGYTGERNPVLMGMVINVLVVAVMAVQFYSAQASPPIHNISTDTDNPPQFAAVVALRGDSSNSLEYNAETLAPLQSAAYPWVKSLSLATSQANTVASVVAVLTDMGLEIVASDPAAGIVEATDTTFWFGFKDDVVVRVSGNGAGSTVDVRSVSRVGVSDLGANARRIGEILRLLTEG
ncbi:MAG: DUF1499 domain-containing protein [Proteobacteria bacterium]|nr:DUF1499 domain-containing protein [Pseudomonadota bacterium]